jgi:hypothetical protein
VAKITGRRGRGNNRRILFTGIAYRGQYFAGLFFLGTSAPIGLFRCVRKYGGIVDEKALARLEALPDFHHSPTECNVTERGTIATQASITIKSSRDIFM